jgi:hypothetical protein
VEQVAVGAIVGTVAAWLWNVVYVLVRTNIAFSAIAKGLSDYSTPCLFVITAWQEIHDKVLR